MPLSIGMGGVNRGLGGHRTLLSRAPSPVIPLAEFKLRLTAGQLGAIATASVLTPAVGIFPVDGNAMVDLNGSAAKIWIALLVTLGIVTTAQAAVILTP